MKPWAKTIQRDDLKACPFCGTAPIEKMRLAENETDMQHQIGCGNSFCMVGPATWVFAGKHDAVEAWQERQP